MRQRCIQAVEGVLNRPISVAESQNIEAAIIRNMRALNRMDPAAWAAMTKDQRLMAAAKEAAKELREEALRKRRNAMLTIEAHDRNVNFVNTARSQGMEGLDAIERLIAFSADERSNVLSLETESRAIRADAVRRMVDLFSAVSPKFMGLFENREGVTLLTKALFGQPSGDAKIDAGAKAWLDTAEMLRKQFNDLGGKIRDLEDWALPQHHSQAKVSNAANSPDPMTNRDQWVRDTLPLLNRQKYFTPDGGLMSTAELTDFLNHAWETLATGGINKLKPGGAKGLGSVANRNSEARSIHFRDADAYLEYQQKYGERDLWSIMVGHVEGLSKQIAQLKVFGPNPDAGLAALLDVELQRSAMADPQSTLAFEARAREIQDLYNVFTGNVAPVANRQLAENFDTLRSWNVASRLGSSVVTAFFTDPVTVTLTAQANKISSFRLWRNQLANLNPFNRADRNLAHRAGLALDVMLGELNRWGGQNLGADATTRRAQVSSRIASTVMRLSLLPALDSANRRAFGATMMHALGEIVQKYNTLADLDPMDNRILLSKGITDVDFEVWKLAQLENWSRGNRVLTPESIAKIPESALMGIVSRERALLQAELQQRVANIQQNAALSPQQIAESVSDFTRIYNDKIAALPGKIRTEAIHRLLGVVLEEGDMAVINPGLKDAFRTGGATQRGTWGGELARSVWQFKGFPMAMIFRHFGRGLSQPTAKGKAWYIAKLVVGTWLMGILAQTVNELLQGKDVRNYDPSEEYGIRNNIAALLKGGALGIYGDFLFSGTTQSSSTGPIAAALGPVAGLVEETFNLTQGNIVETLQGKETNFGAEATRWVRGNTPGASLWYLKASLDHLIFQQMQEALNPGYLRKTERRLMKETGQEYWWEPGTGLEGMRAPEPERAFGEGQ